MGIYFRINIITHNLNIKYIYITITGNDNKYFSGISNYSSEKALNNNLIYKINNSNKISYDIYSSSLGNYVVNNYYNFTIKVSSGKLYNIFYINTIKESAIYGCVLNKDESVNNYNNIIYMEDVNNSEINTINIINDHYYFVNPYTEYKLYSLNNNTLKLIHTINNKSISPGNSIGCVHNFV